MNSLLACQGLLEVQPLHFVCCSTSDGARVERGDIQQVTVSVGATGVPSAVPLISSAMPIPPPATLPTVSASLAALEQELQMLKVAIFYELKHLFCIVRCLEQREAKGRFIY